MSTNEIPAGPFTTRREAEDAVAEVIMQLGDAWDIAAIVNGAYAPTGPDGTLTLNVGPDDFWRVVEQHRLPNANFR